MPAISNIEKAAKSAYRNRKKENEPHQANENERRKIIIMAKWHRNMAYQ
jgi:hypothetical protein